MALDKHTRHLLDAMAATGTPPVHEQNIVAARESMRGRQGTNPPGPDMATVTEVQIPAGAGAAVAWLADDGAARAWAAGAGTAGGTQPRTAPLNARLYTPTDARPGVIVYLHGGGWVMGDLDGFDALARRIAESARMATLLVDYRLAPEHPYPAAVEDAWDALRYVRNCVSADVPVIVGGDSSGGNLAAVVVHRALDEGLDVAGQLLIYPVTDADFTRPSYVDPDNQLLVSRASMIWFWDHYVPEEGRRTEPSASPLRRADVTGLPPAVILTAEHDVLRDEGEEYACRLRQAGVPVEFRRFDGQMHGFLGMPVLPASGDALEFISQSLDVVLEQSIRQY